jgi:hypothetical protein
MKKQSEIRQGNFKSILSTAALCFIVSIALFTACQNPISEGESFGGETRSAVLRLQSNPNAISISTQADLEAITYDLSNDYVLAEDITLVDFYPVGFDPTESETNPFTGTFDGAGHTLTIGSFDADVVDNNEQLGIFAETDGALIQKLNVVFATLALTSSTANYVGGVAAYATNTSFTDITVGGSLDVIYNNTSTTDYRNFYVGGVAAYAESSSFSSIVVDGSIDTSTSMPGNPDYNNYNYLTAGGVVGYATGGTITTSNSAETLNAQSANTISYAGGLAGYVSGTGTVPIELFAITDCTGSGAVTSIGKNTATSAGGIAGHIIQTTVTDSHTTSGDITAAAPSGSGTYDVYQAYAGGLVGYSGYSSTITLSSSKGQNIIADNSAYPYAGGLLGYNYGYNNFVDPAGFGSVVSQSYSKNTVSATATDGGIPYAGGLAGYSSVKGSRIENSYATGNVSALTDGQYSWAGGLIGSNAQDSVVSRCYAQGTVSVSARDEPLPYSQPGINPGAAGGGIAGTNYYTSGALITESVALNPAINGNVGSTTNTCLLHRIAGDLGASGYVGTLTNNDANQSMTGTSPWWHPRSDANGVDGADIDPTIGQPIYAALHWDFSSVWKMDGIYPVLQNNL